MTTMCLFEVKAPEIAVFHSIIADKMGTIAVGSSRPAGSLLALANNRGTQRCMSPNIGSAWQTGRNVRQKTANLILLCGFDACHAVLRRQIIASCDETSCSNKWDARHLASPS